MLVGRLPDCSGLGGGVNLRHTTVYDPYIGSLEDLDVLELYPGLLCELLVRKRERGADNVVFLSFSIQERGKCQRRRSLTVTITLINNSDSDRNGVLSVAVTPLEQIDRSSKTGVAPAGDEDLVRVRRTTGNDRSVGRHLPR